MADTDWEEKAADELLAAGKAAVKRTRWVFLAMNVVGVGLLASQFNSILPWIRNVPARAERNPGMIDQGVLDRINDQLFDQLYVVSAPFLGLKFSVFDLGVIGSITMLVLATWLYYAFRRQNMAVYAIYQYANTSQSRERQSIASFLYHGISHYFVFSNICFHSSPITISAYFVDPLFKTIRSFIEI